MAATRKRNLEQRYDKMCDNMTDLWFKQRIFLALKYATLESRTENQISKFKAWRNWCEESRKKKYFKKKDVLVGKIEAIRNEKLLQ